MPDQQERRPQVRTDNSFLDLVQSAVDVDVGADDVAALLGGEEGHGGGDFLRAAYAALRHLRGDLLLEGGKRRSATVDVNGSGSLDPARRNHVDPDRMAALEAAYVVNACMPLSAAVEPVRMTEAPSLKSGRAFWTVNSVPRTSAPKV